MTESAKKILEYAIRLGFNQGKTGKDSLSPDYIQSVLKEIEMILKKGDIIERDMDGLFRYLVLEVGPVVTIKVLDCPEWAEMYGMAPGLVDNSVTSHREWIGWKLSKHSIFERIMDLWENSK